MGEDASIEQAAWPERALLLTLLGAATGLLLYLATNGGKFESRDPFDTASAAFLAVAGIMLSLGLERRRWTWAAVYAAGAGLAAAFVAWANGAPDTWSSDEGWRFAASLSAIMLALPLFQAVRDAGRFDLSPQNILAHIWTDLILGLAACGFALLAILLTVLLAGLFALIGLDALQTMIVKGWLPLMVACGAFGGAVGLLRDRQGVIDMLQRVVRTILSVLAPILAVGLLLFVASLPFTGLEPLWESTKATTPMMLVAILGAVVLANAVLGNRRDEEAPQKILRASAFALSLVGLPLGLVAAASTTMRIGQYGLTPDRLWAAVFVAGVLAFPVAYLVAIIRGRRSWPETLRRTNVHLAAALSVAALFLALPIVSFGAISARDQVSRLETGRISPERFDWAAMRFDFGSAGRNALERLASSRSALIRTRAAEALGARDRWALRGQVAEPTSTPPAAMVMTPKGATLPPALAEAIGAYALCEGRTCRLEIDSPSRAVLISVDCQQCLPEAALLDRQPDGSWRPAGFGAESAPGSSTALPAGSVEVRTVTARKIYVDGKPIGRAIE